MKNTKPFLFVVVTMLINACGVTIPETDEIPPRILFSITGDGQNLEFETEEDFNEILYLKPDVNYRYRLNVSDAGGLRLAQWQIPDQGFMAIDTAITPPWAIRELSALSRMIEWVGDINNPVNGGVLAGNFKMTEGNTAFSWGFFARDYGGTAGSSNSTSRRLHVNID